MWPEYNFINTASPSVIARKDRGSEKHRELAGIRVTSSARPRVRDGRPASFAADVMIVINAGNIKQQRLQ